MCSNRNEYCEGSITRILKSHLPCRDENLPKGLHPEPCDSNRGSEMPVTLALNEFLDFLQRGCGATLLEKLVKPNVTSPPTARGDQRVACARGGRGRNRWGLRRHPRGVGARAPSLSPGFRGGRACPAVTIVFPFTEGRMLGHRPIS